MKEKKNKNVEEHNIELKRNSNEVKQDNNGKQDKIDKSNNEKSNLIEEEEETIDETKFNKEIEEYTENGLSKLKFYKDKVGLFLFLFVIITISIQTYAVYITYDFREDSNLHHYKLLFYITCFLAVWSHLRASFTNPGKIIHYNNTSVINFYLNTRNTAMKNAEKFNKKVGHIFFRDEQDKESDINDSDDEIKKTKKEERKKKKEERKKLEEESDNSSYDEEYFRPVSAIGDKEMEKIMDDYKVELTRCRQCYVVRIIRAHHCSKCKG